MSQYDAVARNTHTRNSLSRRSLARVAMVNETMPRRHQIPAKIATSNPARGLWSSSLATFIAGSAAPSTAGSAPHKRLQLACESFIQVTADVVALPPRGGHEDRRGPRHLAVGLGDAGVVPRRAGREVVVGPLVLERADAESVRQVGGV